MTNLMEIITAVGGGGAISSIGTWLIARRKVGADLEASYMKLFETAIKQRAERIDKLEERLDAKERDMMEAVKDEREKCKQELIELELRLKMEWDRQITDGRRRLTSRERAMLDTIEDIT